MSPAPIMLEKFWPIENVRDFKVHFARKNRLRTQPLDVLARSPDREWFEWQEYRKDRDRWTREFIFALADFYHETDTWLFGGVFQVLERHPKRYKVRLTDQGAEFIGRLKLKYKARRLSEQYLEPRYGDFEIREILPEPYSGRAFPGLENIDLSFGELETLVRNQRNDWRSRLESVAGVYLISVPKEDEGDDLQRYVGSAYGEGGVWSRWTNYIDTLDGGNAEIRKLLQRMNGDLDFCRKYFRFTLLEHLAHNTPQDDVQKRESHWKRILGTRGSGGLNRN